MDNYNNKSQEVRRISRQNFSRGEQTKPSCLYSTRDDTQEARTQTIWGTIRLIQGKNEGKLEISDEDIKKGIETNAERLGITVNEYHDQISAMTNHEIKLDPYIESNPDLPTETNEPLS
jgi:hypothetical protein